jgi:hypothetical protein
MKEIIIAEVLICSRAATAQPTGLWHGMMKQYTVYSRTSCTPGNIRSPSFSIRNSKVGWYTYNTNQKASRTVRLYAALLETLIYGRVAHSIRDVYRTREANYCTNYY